MAKSKKSSSALMNDVSALQGMTPESVASLIDKDTLAQAIALALGKQGKQGAPTPIVEERRQTILEPVQVGDVKAVLHTSRDKDGNAKGMTVNIKGVGFGYGGIYLTEAHLESLMALFDAKRAELKALGKQATAGYNAIRASKA